MKTHWQPSVMSCMRGHMIAAAALALWIGYAYRLAGVTFLRANVGVLEVGVASIGVLLALCLVPRFRYVHWLALAWLAWSLASITWSLSPAMSLRASLWHALYVAALLLGSAAPRYGLAGLVMVHSVLLLQGVDLVIVTGRDDFNGIWHQQNVQGGQLLLWLPLLAHWSVQRYALSVYVALALGFCVFLSGLTFSMASQVLAVVGVVAVWWWRRHHTPQHIPRSQAASAIGLLFVIGVGLGWLVCQPQAAQVLGFTFGDINHIARVSATTDTLLARWHIIQDVGRRALAGLPWGTGAGSLRDIYSALQRHTIESVDAHNYYLQTLLTLGIVGVSLLVSLFVASLWAAYRAKHAGLWWALFLFMGYLAFDVMAYFPGVMVLFFMTLGVASGLAPPPPSAQNTGISWGRYGATGLFIILPLLWAWWSQPCDDVDCFAGRKLADPLVMRQNISQLTEDEQLEWASIGKTRYPETLFYARLYADTQQLLSETPQVALYRDIALRFPAADLNVYRDWRDAAIRAGEVTEAFEAIRASFDYFETNNDLIISN